MALKKYEFDYFVGRCSAVFKQAKNTFIATVCPTLFADANLQAQGKILKDRKLTKTHAALVAKIEENVRLEKEIEALKAEMVSKLKDDTEARHWGGYSWDELLKSRVGEALPSILSQSENGRKVMDFDRMIASVPDTVMAVKSSKELNALLQQFCDKCGVKLEDLPPSGVTL